MKKKNQKVDNKILISIALFLLFIGLIVSYLFYFRSFTVIFDAKGGTDTAVQSIRINNTVKEPEDPILDDYTFVGWYKSGKIYDFSIPIKENFTLEARWELK